MKKRAQHMNILIIQASKINVLLNFTDKDDQFKPCFYAINYLKRVNNLLDIVKKNF